MNSISLVRNTYETIRIFPPPLEALFISRPNRFLVYCRQGKKLVTAHLPNPGRLQELLLPGSHLLIIPERGKHRKNLYTVVAVKKGKQIIMLDTHRVNAVFRVLLEHGRIKTLKGTKILRTEVRHGPYRFDFLLEHNGELLYLEVKSCTLMGEKVAMFPDTITARGTRHLIELSYLKKQGKEVAVIFLVQSTNVQYFMPDYHTDLLFAQTFLALRNQVKFLPIAIHWEKDLSLRLDTKLLSIPWTYLEREIQDRGSYLLVLNLEKEQILSIGSLGAIFFPEGFYLYVGSAMTHLSKRVERHRRIRKKFHWHIDYLRAVAQLHAILAIRSSDKIECSLAKALSALSQWTVANFGCSDCSCKSHLFGFRSDPLQIPAFQKLLLYFRIDRFESKRDVKSS